jgi:hypothetical protein
VFNCFTIAGAKSCQKHNKLLIFFLSFAKVNKLLNNGRSDTGLKELGIIAKKFFNCGFCANIIRLIGVHSLLKEEVNPLRCIALINFVASHCSI